MTAHIAAPYRRAISYISAAAIAWGLGGAVAASLFRNSGLGPLTVSFWRFAVAAGVLLICGARRPRSASFRRTFLTGAGLAVYQAAYFGSVRYAGLALGTLVTLGASPLLIGVAAHYLFGERLSRRGLAVVAVAVAGLALVVSGPAYGSRPAVGVSFAMLSALGYTIVTLCARRGLTADLSAGTWAAGAVVLLPFALAGRIWPHTSQYGAVTYAELAFLGLVPTILAYRWYFTGLRTVPGTVAAVVVLLEPLTAAVIAVAAFGESMSTLAVLGSALLLAAIGVLTYGAG